MKDLVYLKKHCHKFDLKAEFVNEDTLKVYSPKFFFDSWLIKDRGEDIQLLHMSKKCNLKKCSYHSQMIVKRENKILLLKKIREHNEYVAFYKKYNKINLVDRVLKKGKANV